MRRLYAHLVSYQEKRPEPGAKVEAACGKTVTATKSHPSVFVCGKCSRVLMAEHNRLIDDLQSPTFTYRSEDR